MQVSGTSYIIQYSCNERLASRANWRYVQSSCWAYIYARRNTQVQLFGIYIYAFRSRRVKKSHSLWISDFSCRDARSACLKDWTNLSAKPLVAGWYGLVRVCLQLLLLMKLAKPTDVN